MLNLTVLHVKPNDVRTIETSQADGAIKCVVERPITSNDSNVFPLTESWYLLHATGPVVPGELLSVQGHHFYHLVTTGIISENIQSKTLAKIILTKREKNQGSFLLRVCHCFLPGEIDKLHYLQI